MARWCKQYGLSEPEFQVLWQLHILNGGGTDQSTLAKGLALSPAQVSATVERLRAEGWTAQQPMPRDRRRRFWQLSAEGRTVLQQMLAGTGELRVALASLQDVPAEAGPQVFPMSEEEAA